MEFVIVAGFLALLGLAAWWHKRHADPAEQACARDIGALLAEDRDASSKAIAEVFTQHGVVKSRCPQIGRLVMPQLRKRGLNPEEARMVMRQVRAAYALVPSRSDQ